ncbi:MAG: hypothetical protein KF812_11235 [Fimbriimonadaceae bacterium]|nr:hypothetical protein [Fimbriimonadaceae bacterium]
MQRTRAIQWTAALAISVAALVSVPVFLSAQEQTAAPVPRPAQAVRASSHPVAMNSQYVYIVNGNELLQYNRNMDPVRKVMLEQSTPAAGAANGSESGGSSSSQETTESTTSQQSGNGQGSAQASSSARASSRGSASGNGFGSGSGFSGGGETHIAANDMAVIVTRGGVAYIYDSDNLTPRNAVPIP